MIAKRSHVHGRFTKVITRYLGGLVRSAYCCLATPRRLFLGNNTEFSCLPKISYVVSVSVFWAYLKLLRGPFLKLGLKLAVWTSND